MQLLFLSAGLTLATALVGSPQEGAPTVAAPGPDLGGPLSVGGVEISQNEIKRFLIYGPCRGELEYHRVMSIIEDQVVRRAAGYEEELATWTAIKETGADAGPEPRQWAEEDFAVTDEEYQRTYTRKIKEFRRNYPELDLDTEIRRAYRAVDWFERELRLEMAFDKVFVPDNPDHWPALTFEALREEAGEMLITDFRESYVYRLEDWNNRVAEWQAKVDAGDPAAGPKPIIFPEDTMYRSILRQIVRDAVYGVIDTKTANQGMPDDMICTMDFDWDGEPELSLTTAEMWKNVAYTISQEEVSEARRYLALVEATRQKLVAEKTMVSEEAAQALREELEESLESSPTSLQFNTVGSHMFPSIESYATYIPLFEAYKVSVEPEAATPDVGGLPPVLRAHLNEANQVMGLAKVTAEVLLVSAFDFDAFRWKDNGWVEARQKVDMLKAAIEQNQVEYAALRKARMEAAARGEDFEPEAEVLEPHAFWSKLIDEHSEFWDPPPPVQGKQSAVGYKQLGRFGEKTRNEFRGMLSESQYSQFLNGNLITDKIFFGQQIGTVSGPFRMSWGYCLSKVIRRSPPRRPLNVNDERHVQLLRDDWYRVSFAKYAHEALENAEVVGLPRLR